MSAHVDRRAALAGIAGAVALAAVPAASGPAAAVVASPAMVDLPALFERWQVLEALFEAADVKVGNAHAAMEAANLDAWRPQVRVYGQAYSSLDAATRAAESAAFFHDTPAAAARRVAKAQEVWAGAVARWQAKRAELELDALEGEAERLGDELVAIEQTIAATPAHSLRDVLVKLDLAAALEDVPEPTDRRDYEALSPAHAALRAAMADLRRLAR